MSTAFALVRAAHFLSLMTVFGASALLWQARDIRGIDETMQRVINASAWIAFVTAALWIVLVAREVGDVAVPDAGLLADITTKTYFGKVGIWRLILLLALCDSWYSIRYPGPRAIVAGAALALLGLTSHAASSGAVSLFFARAAVDAAHLLAAGFWVGGLVVLVHEVLAEPRDVPRLVALLRRFSRWGVVSVSVLVIAGALNGVFILGETPQWSGTYVTLLAIKIVLAAFMVAVALVNRFSVLPGLARNEAEAIDTIPLTVIAELSSAIVVLVIVGFLGVTSPMQM
ncbi:MAG: CopD family protein [Alphaproteobacteria bacterium]|nr:CopD family protein [Alphaproteobacteria bacterium]